MGRVGDMQHKLNLTFDFDRNVERKLGQPDSTARMRSDPGPEHTQDELREAVDDRRLTVESGRRVDHPEHSAPAGDSLQAPEFALETAQDRQTGQLG